ncbi:hypothetical protein [Nocardioides sediminis]|uniref:hypothetical protein n=1 Tax=Nocardioides sediminis TaxID=433648 RepID=UPI000D2F6D75|nr:hypothetical protein [Nocardioides sediminis]
MTHPRRTAVIASLATALATVLLPVGLAAPSYAVEPCLADRSATLLDPGCDDTVPPATTLTGTSTPPNAAGWVATSSMTFTFAGAHTDADTDPVTLQCRLDGPAQAHDWATCTSPRTYSGLADAEAAYSFSVRAVDEHDQPITYSTSPLGLTDDEPGEDLDATPATVTWRQDTTAPVVFAVPDVYDEQTPQRPVLASRSLPLRLNSNERDAGIECRLDGGAVPCSRGNGALSGIASGDHVLVARAVDRAGTPSAWSEPFAFSVPADLTKRRGWKKRKAAGSLDGTVLVSRTQGARLVVRARKVGELRLYAPTAPSYGKVRLRVGRTAWRTVDLGRARAAQREIVVIDQFSGTRKGRVTIEVLSRGRTVKLDAVLARANVRTGD